MEDKKALQKAKNLFTSLKTNPNSVLFSEEKINARLMKKFKESRYAKNSLLLKLIFLADKKLDDEEKVPTRVDYVEKREIDRSMLYSFDGPFQLIRADRGNLEFWGEQCNNLTICFTGRRRLFFKSICLSYAFKETNPKKHEIIL